jgi:hypothetical protein
MDDNSLLMIVLAFVVGYMCSGMVKKMCGRQRLVEGSMWGDYANWYNNKLAWAKDPLDTIDVGWGKASNFIAGMGGGRERCGDGNYCT